MLQVHAYDSSHIISLLRIESIRIFSLRTRVNVQAASILGYIVQTKSIFLRSEA